LLLLQFMLLYVVKNFADLDSSFKGPLSGHGLLCRHASEEGW